VEPRFDAGTQDFDRDGFGAVRGGDFGAVHLCDRGSRNRGPEGGKDRMQRPAEGSRDRGFSLRLRKRRHLVLQPLQIVGERCADHIRPRRQELA